MKWNTRHIPPDLAPNDFWLFPELRYDLKVQRFQDTEDIQKMRLRFWKLFYNRSSKNVFSSGSTVGLHAWLLKVSTSKMIPLIKL
jgi:hypothetical protein